MRTVADLFAPLAAQIQKLSRSTGIVTPDTVYQPGNLETRRHFHSLADSLLLPGSRFENIEALIKLAELSRQGKSCLLLVEHYSNFDIPNLYRILERSGQAATQVASQIISIAGAKLNETSLFVRAFTEAYDRIVIYPSRSLDSLRLNAEANAEEIKRARAINMASLHQMVRLKHAGHIILVFPTGTRYRPGDESTKRGLKEMDSYIKSFDYLLFIGMAGNTLRINTQDPNRMELDNPTDDTVIFAASDVVNAHEFRSAVRPSGGEADPKQVVADAIMAELEILHRKAQALHDAVPVVK